MTCMICIKITSKDYPWLSLFIKTAKAIVVVFDEKNILRFFVLGYDEN